MENQSRHSSLSGHRQRVDFNPASTCKSAFVFGAALLSLMLFLVQAGATTTNLINVDIGSTANVQTGAAVLGGESDVWNGVTSSTDFIKDSTGTTLVGVSFTDAGYWVFNDNTNGTAMDTATTPLMRDCVAGNTAVSGASFTLSLSGLSAHLNDPFTLVVYGGAGDPNQGDNLTLAGVTGGNTASKLSISGASRSINKTPPNGGLGVSYQIFTGTLTNSTLTITVSSNLSQFYGVNGFQLQLVDPDPTILAQPVSHSVVVGQSATFTVIPSGTAPFNYQWQAGAAGSGIFTNLIDDGNISGATKKNLTIFNVTTNQALAYVVVVKNDKGAVTSSPALLTADSSTRLIDVAIGNGALQTGAAVLGASGDVWNQVTAKSTTPIVDANSNTVSGVGLTFTSYAGINNNNPAGTAMDATTTNLMEDYADGDNTTTANLILNVGNLGEYLNSHFTLIVYAAGNASGQGATLTLTGAKGGNSADTLITSALTRQISAGVGVAYQVFMGTLTNGTLTITATENAGQRFTALNGFQLWLTPAIPPIITTQPVSQTNDNVSFSAAAVGMGSLSYQWQAGPIGSGIFSNLVDGAQLMGSSCNILRIFNATSNFSLAYRLIVSNDSGSVTSSVATLNILPGSLITIQNANFDADTISGPDAPTHQITTPTGWTWNGRGGVGLLSPSYFYTTPTPGVSMPNALYTQSPDGVANPGVSQTLTDTLNSNTTYTLSVQVGNRISGTWGGYHITLMTANGSMVGDWVGENNSIAVAGTFATSSRSFTTGPNPPGLGQPLQIVLEQAAPAIGSYSDFDSVSLTATPAPPHPQGTPIDVYVCAGQSNAHGWRANPDDLNQNNLHYVNAPDMRALFAYQANLVTQGSFYSQGSMGQLSTEGAGYSGNFSGFGPELSAGSDLAKRFGRPLAMVKFASGGADLHTQFAKSANFLYPRLIAEVTNSLQQLIDQGYTPTVKGFFWLQGESDALLNPSTYASDIAQFVNDIRTDLKKPSLQFVLTEINPNLQALALNQAGVSQVNQAMINLEMTDPNVKIVKTADILSGFADTVHYSADQIITIGQRWAASFTAEPNLHVSPP